MENKFLNARQAAELVGRTVRAISLLATAGKIPGARQDERGQWRIPEESLGSISTGSTSKYEWTLHEIDLLGTDTDTRVGALIGRSAEAVRDMRKRCGVKPFPERLPAEQQLPRMTTERLKELEKLIQHELERRKNEG